MTMRQLINTVTEAVTDDWFRTGSFETFKLPARERFTIADSDGTIETLEGPVRYKTGDYIMIGPKGEQYPIPPQKFRELKDLNDDGTASPKKIIKVAKLADHDGIVNTSWAEPLNYTRGNDYIVRHGPNDYGVVKRDIFKQTYNTKETK
jgi:hypothetical protein